jgi:hypothetical protein
LPLGRRFWPLSESERRALYELVQRPVIQRLVTELVPRPADDDDEPRVRLVDAAYWVKGCSSLGLRRAAALIEVSTRRRIRVLLDLKRPLLRSHLIAAATSRRIPPSAWYSVRAICRPHSESG